MRMIAAVTCLALIGGATALNAATVVRYRIEGSSTAVAKVAFLGLASKSAKFDAISGRVSFSPTNMSTLDINVAIDASKLQAGDGATLKRLKGKDFFWVEKYPTVTFIGKKLTLKTATTGTVSGDLTVRDVTKPVSMAVTFSTAPRAGDRERAIYPDRTDHHQSQGFRHDRLFRLSGEEGQNHPECETGRRVRGNQAVHIATRFSGQLSLHSGMKKVCVNLRSGGKLGWCGQEDSNFHGISPTTTSTLRVYQFRHGRIPLP